MTSIGWLLFALFLSAKVLVVLAAALWLTRLMRDRSAAERHLVWVVASACVLALPVLSLASPLWRVAMPSWVYAPAERPARSVTVARPAAVVEIVVPERASRARRPVPAASARRAPRPVAPPAVTAESVPEAPARPPVPAPDVDHSMAPLLQFLPSLALVSLLLWLTGTLAVLVWIAAGSAGARRAARNARPVRDGALLAHVHGTATALGIRRPVRVLEGNAATMPMTFGIVRPALLLPSSAGAWTPARRNAVVRHELEHVRRHDSLTQLIAELGCALYWFNPLMWWAARRMCVEREHACDDAVLASGSRASDYAADLVAIARTLKAERRTQIAAIAMARQSHLRARVSSLLDAHRRRERPTMTLMVPVWAGALLLVAPLSSVAPEAGGRAEFRAQPHAVVEVSVAAAVRAIPVPAPRPPRAPAAARAVRRD